MIPATALLPLAAALLSSGLAVITLLGHPRGMDRLRWAFVGMNVSIVIWCSAFIAQPGGAGSVSSAALVFGAPEYWSFNVIIAGMSGTATYWFLFAAAFTQRSRLFEPARLWIVHAPMIVGVLVAATSPWHELYAVPTQDGVLTYGLLFLPLSLSLYILSFGGTGLMLTYATSSRIRLRHARIAAVASLVPTLAALAWNLRDVIGISPPFNPGAPAFALFSAVLAWLVYREGMGEILPSVAALAFKHASDAAIATDEDLTILALNDAARELMPAAHEGQALAGAMPDLASYAQGCASGMMTNQSFELHAEGRVLAGRARATSTPSGKPLGCVILLTDISVLRQAEKALERIESRDQALGFIEGNDGHL